MDNNSSEKKSVKLWVGVIAALMIILGVAVFFIIRQQRNMKEMVEGFEIQKEELEDEYSDLAVQYEGFSMNISNDSLLAQLDSEKMKVQRLQEELRTVKSTNAKRINELKKELSTLRSVMRTFVIQIDSLNQQNQRLEAENKSVTKQYQAVTKTAAQLKKDKEALSEQVTKAAKLDAVAISVLAMTKRAKETTKISKTEQLKVNFTIGKNITAESGEKFIYVRIMKPDDEPLIKNRADLFKYEDREINYSMRKLIEYEGEEVPVTMFWQVEEFLYPGKYRVDIFADGHLIGKKTFELEK